MRCDRGAARAAKRTDRVESPFGLKAEDDLCYPAPHHLDGRAAIAGVGKGLHVGPRCSCDLLAGDVGLGERIAQDPGVDEKHVHASRGDVFAYERVLAALGVERAHEDDSCSPVG